MMNNKFSYLSKDDPEHKGRSKLSWRFNVALHDLRFGLCWIKPEWSLLINIPLFVLTIGFPRLSICEREGHLEAKHETARLHYSGKPKSSFMCLRCGVVDT